MVTDVGVGTRSYVRYGYENAFGTAAVDAQLSTFFGHNVKFTATPKNNFERIPGLNQRNFQKHASKKFEGTFGVDFQLSNAFMLKGVVGAVTSAGSAPTTHTYAESNVCSSATIQMSEDLDIDNERSFLGCVFDKLTLTMTTGEVVSGRLDGFYAKETKDATLNTTGNAADPEEVFTFAHASLEYPDGTTLTEIESLEITITNNVEIIYGLGSRLGTQRAFKQRVYDVNVTRVREDNTFLDDFYGGPTSLTDPSNTSGAVSLQIILSNGETGAAQREIQFTLQDIRAEDYAMPLNPAEVLKESVVLMALSGGSITYKDDTTAEAKVL